MAKMIQPPAGDDAPNRRLSASGRLKRQPLLVHQSAIASTVGIAGFDHLVFHAARHRDLVGELFLGLDNRVVDLVITFHLHDDVFFSAVPFLTGKRKSG